MMLHLTEEFSLIRIFNEIPEDQLVIPKECIQRLFLKHKDLPLGLLHFKLSFLEGLDTPQDVTLDIHTSGLTLVGHERNGQILLSRTAYNPDTKEVCTYFDTFHLKKKLLSTVYKHGDVISCVGCSLNSEGTLLAFTTFNRKPVDQKPPSKAAPPNPTDIITIPTSPHPGQDAGGNSPLDLLKGQTVGHDESEVPGLERKPSKSLDPPNEGDSKSVFYEYYESSVTEVTGRNPKCYVFNRKTDDIQLVQFVNTPERKRRDLVCFIYNRKFGIYEISSKETQKDGIPCVKIDDHPIGKHYSQSLIWYQWMPQKPLLFIIERSRPNPLNYYFLVCYTFPQLKGSNTAPKELFRQRIPEPEIGDKISIVRLASGDDKNVVLCYQKFISNTNSISVLVYLLLHDLELNFEIPLPTYPKSNEISVYFDNLGDLLLIYIPGHYFQLINCSPDDEPHLSLYCTGDLATPLPHQIKDPATIPQIVRFTNTTQSLYSLPNGIPQYTINTSGQTFFDKRNGTVYKYNLNREAVLNLFKTKRKVLETPRPRITASPLKSKQYSRTHSPTPSKLSPAQNSTHNYTNFTSRPPPIPTSPPKSRNKFLVTQPIPYDLSTKPTTKSDSEVSSSSGLSTSNTSNTTASHINIHGLYSIPNSKRTRNYKSKTILQKYHVQALNLAAVHMQDFELVDEIIAQVCKNLPNDYNTVQIFKEYLIGTTYVEAVRGLQQFLARENCLGAQQAVVMTHCISVFPITSLPSIQNEAHDDKIRVNVTIQPCKLKNDRFKLGSIINSIPEQRFENLSTSGGLYNGATALVTESTFGRIIGRLFSMRPFNYPTQGLGAESSPSPPPPPFNNTLPEVLTQHLYITFPRDTKVPKKLCYQVGSYYWSILSNQIEKLYSHIVRLSKVYNRDKKGFEINFNENISEDKKKEIGRLFEGLCCLNLAVEECWCSKPRNLKEDLAWLGYQYLDKNVWMQYLRFGLFEVTPSFVESVIPGLGSSKTDILFKYLLLSKLPPDTGIKLLSNDSTLVDTEERVDFLLDYKLSKQKKCEVVDLEEMEDADFLPLTVYLESLKFGPYSEGELDWMVFQATSQNLGNIKL